MVISKCYLKINACLLMIFDMIIKYKDMKFILLLCVKNDKPYLLLYPKRKDNRFKLMQYKNSIMNI